MKLFTVFAIAFIAHSECRGQTNDSTFYEYARVSTLSTRILAYYEDGHKEDLKKILSLTNIGSSDSTASHNFFKITGYLRAKGFDLLVYIHDAPNVEYIFRKKAYKTDTQKSRK